MPSYNKVTLMGNLTRDPELKYTPKGTAVCKIGLAVNRTWRTETGEKKEEVTFVDVDTFGKTAENLAQYNRKGSCVFLEGRLKLDVWTDNQTGKQRSRLGVVAELVQFIGGKREDTQQGPPQRQKPANPKTDGVAENYPGTEPEEDDVPF